MNLAQVIGLAEEIEFRGVAYEVRPLDLEVVARFEQWLRRQSRDKLRRLHERGIVDAKELSERLKVLAQNQDYGFMGKLGRQAQTSMEGCWQLIRLRLQPRPDADTLNMLLKERSAELFHCIELLDGGDVEEGPTEAGAEDFDWRELASVLTSEPFSLTLSEVRRLTLPQIFKVYFCERNEYGAPKITHAKPAPTLSPQDVFRLIGRKRGLREHTIERKWKERVTEQRRG